MSPPTWIARGKMREMEDECGVPGHANIQNPDGKGEVSGVWRRWMPSLCCSGLEDGSFFCSKYEVSSSMKLSSMTMGRLIAI